MTIIKCHQISKRYEKDDKLALDSLSFEIKENTVFGFLGPNGAGKTTTIKILTGLMQPSSGNAIVAGETVRRNSIALRSKIGYLSQEPAMYKWMKGKELLMFVGNIFGLSTNENRKRADLLLEMSGLTDVAHKKMSSYSGGMLQRLGIAQALVSKPKVLFLDEPTSSLDPIGRKEVLEFITNLKNETTVFMSTHILSDVERVCDHVGIINNGQLLICEELKELKKKYLTNVCEIETYNIDDINAVIEILKKNNTLNYQTKDNIIKLYLSDTNSEFSTILMMLSNTDKKIKRIEQCNASLEDIFIELVKTH